MLFTKILRKFTKKQRNTMNAKKTKKRTEEREPVIKVTISMRESTRDFILKFLHDKKITFSKFLVTSAVEKINTQKL